MNVGLAGTNRTAESDVTVKPRVIYTQLCCQRNVVRQAAIGRVLAILTDDNLPRFNIPQPRMDNMSRKPI
jgi:hypothetical protein